MVVTPPHYIRFNSRTATGLIHIITSTSPFLFLVVRVCLRSREQDYLSTRPHQWNGSYLSEECKNSDAFEPKGTNQTAQTRNKTSFFRFLLRSSSHTAPTLWRWVYGETTLSKVRNRKDMNYELKMRIRSHIPEETRDPM